VPAVDTLALDLTSSTLLATTEPTTIVDSPTLCQLLGLLLATLPVGHSLHPSPSHTPFGPLRATIFPNDLAPLALRASPILYVISNTIVNVPRLLHPYSSLLRCKGVRRYTAPPSARMLSRLIHFGKTSSIELSQY
jgi:hypothetical protein